MELMHQPQEFRDPALWWLMVISAFREDAPWLFELGMEVHKALKLRDPRRVSAALSRFDDSLRILRHTEIGHHLIDSPEMEMVMHEIPRILDRFLIAEPPPPRKVASKSKNEVAQRE